MKPKIKSFDPADADELEAYRIKYLGTKGIVKQMFGEMKNVPAEQKKEAGQLLNAFKQLAEGKYEDFKHLQSGGSKKQTGSGLSPSGHPGPSGHPSSPANGREQDRFHIREDRL